MEKRFYAVLKTLCFLLMLAMITVIFAQVLARYLFTNSLSWSEEVGRYLFVWMTFIGSAVAVRNRLHVALDMVIVRLAPAAQRLCLAIGYLAMLVFTAVLIDGGYHFVARSSLQTSAALQIPMRYVYLVLPFGGGLIFFYLLKNFYEDVFVRR